MKMKCNTYEDTLQSLLLLFAFSPVLRRKVCRSGYVVIFFLPFSCSAKADVTVYMHMCAYVFIYDECFPAVSN